MGSSRDVGSNPYITPSAGSTTGLKRRGLDPGPADPSAQAYLLADKTEANIGIAERRAYALTAVDEIARLAS